MPALSSLLRRLHQRYCMYRLTLTAPLAIDPPAVDGLAWQFLDEASATRLFADEPAVQRFVLRLVARKYVGVVLTVNGCWAAYVWLALPGQARPPHVPARIEPRAYWLFSSATQPQFAGKGLYKFAMRLLIAEAFRRSPTLEMLADVEPQNVPPRRGTASVGFEPYGMLDCNYLWIPRLLHVPLNYRWDRTAPHPPMPGAR